MSSRRGLGQPGVRGARGAPLPDPAPCQTQHPARRSISTPPSTSTLPSWLQHPGHRGNWDGLGWELQSFLPGVLKHRPFEAGFPPAAGLWGEIQNGRVWLRGLPAAGWWWQPGRGSARPAPARLSSPGWSYQGSEGASQEAAPLVDPAPGNTAPQLALTARTHICSGWAKDKPPAGAARPGVRAERCVHPDLARSPAGGCISGAFGCCARCPCCASDVCSSERRAPQATWRNPGLPRPGRRWKPHAARRGWG